MSWWALSGEELREMMQEAIDEHDVERIYLRHLLDARIEDAEDEE